MRLKLILGALLALFSAGAVDAQGPYRGRYPPPPTQPYSPRESYREQYQNDPRQVWRYPGGGFRYVGGRRWQEWTRDGVNPFWEVRRTPEFIELRSGNGEPVRIYANQLLHRTRGEDWTPEYNGEWETD